MSVKKQEKTHRKTYKKVQKNQKNVLTKRKKGGTINKYLTTDKKIRERT